MPVHSMMVMTVFISPVMFVAMSGSIMAAVGIMMHGMPAMAMVAAVHTICIHPAFSILFSAHLCDGSGRCAKK